MPISIKLKPTTALLSVILMGLGIQSAAAQTVVLINKMGNDATTNNPNMLCFQPNASTVPAAQQYNLSPNGSVWVSAGPKKQQAQYAIHLNAANNDCSNPNNGYGQGYIGVGTDAISSSDPGYGWDYSGQMPAGVSVTQSTNPKMDCGQGADVCYIATYTAPQPPVDPGNNNYPNAQTYTSGIPYRGVNLSGAEFQDDGSGKAQQGTFTPTVNDAALFLYRGMNVYRVPIAWEYLADINGNLKTDAAGKQYLAKLDSLVRDLSKKNAYILIDMHDYMRYNPSNVALDYLNSDPNGADVIGSGSQAPTQAAYQKVWQNIATRYQGSNMMYDIMNEPHDISMTQVLNNQNAAIAGIRAAESAAGIKTPHLIMIEGNYWTGLHSWTGDGMPQSSPTNAQSYAQSNSSGIKDSGNNYAIEVHQYFDQDASGTYVNGDCLSPSDFLNGYTFNGQQQPGFTQYWSDFTKWAQANHTKVFLGEFGAPDTANCRADINTVLNSMTNFAYTPANGYGVIGWSVWAAGGSWGNYVISIAPGGPANTLMWDNELYQNYLTEKAELPALGAEILQVTNGSPSTTLLFSSGAWPFQVKGSASLAPGQTATIYSPDQTTSPAGQYEYAYHVGSDTADVLGTGVNGGFGYGYGTAGNLSPQANTSCNIKPSNGDTKRCWTVK